MKVRIVTLKNDLAALKEINEIGVYPESIKFLKPKASFLVIKLQRITSAASNIIKQEMLSVGADAAVAKDVITGKIKYSNCLLFGNISQFNKLVKKLQKQPLGLKEIGQLIKEVIVNYQKVNYTFKCGNYKLHLGRKVYIMGILNVTPDSFSDGNKFYSHEAAVNQGLALVAAGADIIDIGGESTRPGAKRVSVDEQINRVVPVIGSLKKKVKKPISIDTRSSKVAKAAIKAGASIINDVSGLRSDPKVAQVAAKYKTGLILMHSKDTPQSMQKDPKYKSLMSEIIDGLNKSISVALKNKVNKEQIIVDPGIGFSKTTEHNLKIINNLAELKVLGYPVLIGTSRKSVIGNVLNLPVEKRLAGTIATVVYSVIEGANIIRAHDVREIYQAVKMTQAITKAGNT